MSESDGRGDEGVGVEPPGVNRRRTSEAEARSTDPPESHEGPLPLREAFEFCPGLTVERPNNGGEELGLLRAVDPWLEDGDFGGLIAVGPRLTIGGLDRLELPRLGDKKLGGLGALRLGDEKLGRLGALRLGREKLARLDECPPEDRDDDLDPPPRPDEPPDRLRAGSAVAAAAAKAITSANTAIPTVARRDGVDHETDFLTLHMALPLLVRDCRLISPLTSSGDPQVPIPYRGAGWSAAVGAASDVTLFQYYGYGSPAATTVEVGRCTGGIECVITPIRWNRFDDNSPSHARAWCLNALGGSVVIRLSRV